MRLLMIVFLMTLSLVGVSCKETTKKMKGDVIVEASDKSDQAMEKRFVLNKNSIAFKEKHILPKLFDAYQMISEDLVNADMKSAKKHSANLLQAVADTKDPDWDRLKQIIVTLAEVEELEAFRLGFFELTKALEEPFRENISSGEIYKQYCPMAFHNEGAYWFASDKEIMNPYFGEEMLHCGAIEETFKAK